MEVRARSLHLFSPPLYEKDSKMLESSRFTCHLPYALELDDTRLTKPHRNYDCRLIGASFMGSRFCDVYDAKVQIKRDGEMDWKEFVIPDGYYAGKFEGVAAKINDVLVDSGIRFTVKDENVVTIDVPEGWSLRFDAFFHKVFCIPEERDPFIVQKRGFFRLRPTWNFKHLFIHCPAWISPSIRRSSESPILACFGDRPLPAVLPFGTWYPPKNIGDFKKILTPKTCMLNFEIRDENDLPVVFVDRRIYLHLVIRCFE